MFNGKLIYEVFSGKKDFGFGRQPNLVEGTNTVREYGIDFETNFYRKEKKKKEKENVSPNDVRMYSIAVHVGDAIE